MYENPQADAALRADTPDDLKIEKKDESDAEEDLSESGMDWDELEEEAAAEDAEASDSDRGKKRKKGKR